MAQPNQSLYAEDIIFAKRVDMMSRHAELSEAAVLEIGAYDRPTFMPDAQQSFFLDYLSREQLSVKAEEIGRNVENIPHVDYVASTNLLSQEVDRSFDLVVANHVIEHMPNPIEWLMELSSILTSEGHLFLSVPDRRYTFDYLRTETEFLELLQRYVNGCASPDFWKIAEVRLLERPQIRGELAWHAQLLTDALEESTLDPVQALEQARVDAQQSYVDVHCSVFTYSSFMIIIECLQKVGLFPFDVLETDDVLPGKLEFHVLFKKKPGFNREEANANLAKLLPRTVAAA